MRREEKGYIVIGDFETQSEKTNVVLSLDSYSL